MPRDARPSPAPAIPAEELAALETRLAEDPDDRDAWAVYGDLLQRHGDPRGELVALQLAAEAERTTRGAARTKGPAERAAAKMFARHAPGLLGPLAGYVKDLADPSAPPFVWRAGTIQRAVLTAADGDLPTILRALVAQPSGRLLSELALQLGGTASARATLDALAEVAPPALHELDVFARAELGDLGPLWPRLPRLRRLYLSARTFELGELRLPAVRRARFTPLVLSPASMTAIATAPWPHLERLELRFGTYQDREAAELAHVRPLLQRTDLPALTHLKLRRAPFAGAIARALAESPLAGQLEVIDLSHGSLTPRDAEILAAAKHRFTRLRELWLPFAGLWGNAAKSLDGIARNVINDSRAPVDRLEDELLDRPRFAPIRE